jgi:hypothetical protein
MNVSKEDAEKALDMIGEAGAHMATLKWYSRVAPLLFVWGSVWFIANAVTDFAPDRSGIVWMAGATAGVAVSVLLSLRLIRRRSSQFWRDITDREEARRRFGMLAIAILCFFPAMFAVLRPLNARQENAFISLVWAFLYMFAGAWFGWRLFAIGAIAVAATIVGYLAVEQHYYLWMACCGGGSLIAGGLWLRKI